MSSGSSLSRTKLAAQYANGTGLEDERKKFAAERRAFLTKLSDELAKDTVNLAASTSLAPRVFESPNGAALTSPGRQPWVFQPQM